MGRLLLQQTVPPRPVREREFQGAHPYFPEKTKKDETTLIQQEIPDNVRQLHSTHKSESCHPHVTMQLDVKAADAPKLRQLAASVCGDNLSSIRISPVSRTKNVHIWLSLKNDACLVDIVMTTIMRHLPSAQFGHFNAA